jgi:hypothetical protein
MAQLRTHGKLDFATEEYPTDVAASNRDGQVFGDATGFAKRWQFE